MADQLQLEVVTPERRLLADAVSSVTVPGRNGEMQILPGHAALISDLETGVLSVNANTSVRVQTPFGGFKQSGFGRELGMHALDGYSEVKNVFMAT